MGGAVVTVGTFDGVHRGHQAVLARVGEVARGGDLDRVAYAFDRPPRLLSEDGADPCLLLPQAVKMRLLEAWVDRVERADFEGVRDLSAADFIERVLLERLAARAVVVGESFRFGRGREGNLSLLRRVGKAHGLRVVAVPPVVVGGESVSSTRIRALLALGRVGEARELLGRPPLLVGLVVAGDGLGRALGYPTANLALDPSVLRPGSGIYLAYAFWLGKESPGLLYVGERPTVKGQTLRAEVHLLDSPEEELYGRTLEVQILARLRDDRAFPSLAELRHEMDQDAERARALLASSGENPRSILT